MYVEKQEPEQGFSGQFVVFPQKLKFKILLDK